MAGKAWTVLGPIEPSQLGITLVHEHLLIDEVPAAFELPAQASQRILARQPVSLELLGWLRTNGSISNEDNLRLDDEEVMAEEILRFKYAGGRTIVDATSIGLGRDPEGLRRLSLRTGLNVIAGSGYYVAASHPREIESKDIDDIKTEIINDIHVGIQSSGVQAGIIGEIGTTYPCSPNERKVLQAGARAQLETGAPVEVHPGRNRRMPGMILDLLEKEGADLSRVVMCHVEARLGDFAEVKSIADRGCFIGFDLFGQSWTPYVFEIPMPSDGSRVHRIKQLVEDGYVDKILVSHDIDNKISLHRFGGHGFDHILLNIVPLMLKLGIAPEDIHKILLENPARLLAFT